MPFIQFNARELLKGKPVAPAWYTVRIESVGEAPSKDGGSTNYPVEGTIVRDADNGSEEYASYPLDWNFNSKAITYSVPFLESLGVTVAAGQRYDLNAAAGMVLDVYVENKLFEGRTINNVPHRYRATKKAE